MKQLNPRLVGLGFVVGAGGVFAVARYLEPSPHGLGTHHQLGMSPCNFLTLTGIPCPGCGLTTTFTHIAHGNFLEALGTQPFGVVLFALMTLSFFLGLGDLVLGKSWVQGGMDFFWKRHKVLLGLFFTGMFLGWVFKILRHNFGF